MRPSRPLTPLAGLVLLLLVATAVPYAAPEPARGGLANARHPYLGVTLISRVVTSPRLARLHVAQVDLRAPGVQIALTPPAGGREVVRERTVDALVRANAQLAVNGHFFLPFPSDDPEAWVLGLAATDGRVFSDFEIPEQSYALVAHAPALNLDRRNRARIVHHQAGRNGRRVRERVTLWNAVAGSAQIVTGSRVTIPAYRDDTHPRGVLKPGPDGRYSNARSWYDVVTSRTVVGLSRNRRILTLVAAEGRGGTEGLTVGELATLLARDYGVWDAINLDGGGSTTMAWLDPDTHLPALLNTPSDDSAGRRVASSLLVFARPAGLH